MVNGWENFKNNKVVWGLCRSRLFFVFPLYIKLQNLDKILILEIYLVQEGIRDSISSSLYHVLLLHGWTSL